MNSPEFYCYDYALHALNSTSALLSIHSAALSVSYTFTFTNDVVRGVFFRRLV